jgi:hypothetical protein
MLTLFTIACYEKYLQIVLLVFEFLRCNETLLNPEPERFACVARIAVLVPDTFAAAGSIKKTGET